LANVLGAVRVDQVLVDEGAIAVGQRGVGTARSLGPDIRLTLASSPLQAGRVAGAGQGSRTRDLVPERQPSVGERAITDAIVEPLA